MCTLQCFLGNGYEIANDIFALSQHVDPVLNGVCCVALSELYTHCFMGADFSHVFIDFPTGGGRGEM